VAKTIDHYGTKIKLPDPWERQSNETPQAFEAFVIFRDMEGKRSYKRVSEQLQKSETLIGRWGRKHRWQSRREAWEDEQDRLVREELIKGITTMRKTHTAIAGQMLVKALKALQSLPVEDMTMQDIARAVDVAAKLERLSRGEATERTEGNANISGKITIASDPYDELSVEELRKLAQLADNEQEI
jgi:hypothetical protein